MAVGVAIAALVVTAAASYQQSQQAKAAAKDRKEAAQVGQAEQSAQLDQNRRAQVREERVRRASIIQNSRNTGVGESSGDLGAQSALGSLIGSNLAGMSRQQSSATAIGNNMQSAANADLAGAQWGAVGQMSSSIFGTAASIAMTPKPTTQVKPTPSTSPSVFGG